ncbi:MAG: hypothetical protein EKK29_18745 [Hyphomicrobiales bacterium]|nr:MAG: hypothetical protein EKK29_18745 [Hyphomicrobiales bacterium]
MKQRRYPSRFEPFREPDMLGSGRKAQKPIAKRPDRAPRIRHVGLSKPGRIEKGQLNRDDYA